MDRNVKISQKINSAFEAPLFLMISALREG